MNLQKIAKNIINTNMGFKNKDAVLIWSGTTSLNFAEMLALECWKKGAIPVIEYRSDKLFLNIHKKTKPEFLKNWPKHWDAMSKTIDAWIILDDINPFIAKKFPQNKIEITRKIFKQIKDKMYEKTMKKTLKIALMGFPNKEQAKALKISYKKLYNIFWNTMNVDYKKLHRDTLKLSKKFLRKNKIRIIGKNTDLELSIKNRSPIIGSGLIKKEKFWFLNLPSGEVFFAPVETSANGEIYFDLPCMWHYGKQVKGVWFKFKKGRIVDYQIEKGLKDFESVLKNASGSKDRIAELGIGTNPKAKTTGGLTIVDEKVKGTIHIAIGENRHFGGKNKSTIHWDFFKDMRKKSEMYVDNKLVMKNGRFI
ncbi:MAG: aminopeptidase [Candidatus Hodarchaeales archaeon]|jgi:aminopeptidase